MADEQRSLYQQAYDIMSSYSGGPCLDGCEHDDCAEYRRVQDRLETMVRLENMTEAELEKCEHPAHDENCKGGCADPKWLNS